MALCGLVVYFLHTLFVMLTQLPGLAGAACPGRQLPRELFIVRPHPQDTNGPLGHKNLVHHAMLNSDAARVGTCKIPDQLLEGRWILKWIGGKNREQILCLWLQPTGSELVGIFHCLLGKHERPTHH